MTPQPEQFVDCIGLSCQSARETSATSSAGNGVTTATTVVMYNDVPGPSFMGWAWSSDGTTWHQCNAASPGCGSGGGLVPRAPTQATWAGDPQIAADPSQPQVVVAANLANSIQNANADPDLVVVSTSLDGGRTFIQTQIASTGACAGGVQDMEAIAFDPTTSPATLWVAWRHVVNQLATAGACVVAGHVDASTGAVLWTTPARQVPNLDHQDTLWGIGGVMIQAGDGIVTLAYSNTDHTFFNCEQDRELRWFTVSSGDDGATWGPNNLVHHTTSFEWCLFNNQILNTIRAFGFVRGVDGIYWMAVHDSHESIRVFESFDLGVHWVAVHRVLQPQGGSLLFPTLASDARGRVALSYSSATDFGDISIARNLIASEGATGPAAWSAPLRISTITNAPPGMPGCPFPETCNLNNTFLSRDLGDYDGMAAVAADFPAGGAAFAPAWSTNTFATFTTVQMAYVGMMP